jgi:hypothetical protein
MTNRGNFDYPEKPTDWPVNNVECTIENILNAVEKIGFKSIFSYRIS